MLFYPLTNVVLGVQLCTRIGLVHDLRPGINEPYHEVQVDDCPAGIRL